MAKVKTERIDPDQVILNPIQQKRLSAISDIDEKEISGKNVAQLSDVLKWRVPPHLLFFERICGKVVKKDPVTGQEYPVPFATVYVEDTDCDIIVYHPVGYPWCWHYPLICRREVIGTTQTDACGNFCVWVPRFDIDWILRWRRERICFPVIFKRPNLGDLVKQRFPIPFPDPDPDPWEKFATVLNSIQGSQVNILRDKISKAKSSLTLGATTQGSNELLNTQLFDHDVPAPLSADFQKVLSGQNVIASKNASASDAVRSAIGKEIGIQAGDKVFDQFDPRGFRGPFFRCIDIEVPIWQRIVDVPDITFRVTQDTNGDGVEETIYSEGYFDVRWDSGPISNVTLVASSIAKESRFCNTPPVPCGDAPALLFAGFMSLTDLNYFDSTTGYALRPNRPRPGGVATFPAQTPFCEVVQLYGCVAVQNATYYRIQSSTDGGATYAAITGLAWNNFFGTTPIPIIADPDGWYPIDPINPATLSAVPRASLEFPNLLLDWPTPAHDTSLVKIELGDNAKNHITDSAVVAITSDNTSPGISLTTLSWKYSGESDAALRSLVGVTCPMIQRGTAPQDIELVFQTFVSALHLRDAGLGTSGCGDGSFVPVTTDPLNNPSHWHQTIFDNSVTLYQRYSLSASSKPGCYSFGCTANSRAMNPSGADGGNLLPTDWFYDPVYIYTPFSISVAVVNEDES